MITLILTAPYSELTLLLWELQVDGISKACVPGPSGHKNEVIIQRYSENRDWCITVKSEFGGELCIRRRKTIEGAIEYAGAYLANRNGGILLIYWNLSR